MTSQASEKYAALIVEVGNRVCAIPLSHVAEIMRPLPVVPIGPIGPVVPLRRMPDFIRGISVIRGAPVPVVDLGTLLSNGVHDAAYQRLVSVKLGERRVAFGVDRVVGVRNLAEAQLKELPPLFQDRAADLIEAIEVSDAQLLMVLRATRIVPDEVWAHLAQGKDA